MFDFLKKKQPPAPPATLEYAVKQGVLTVEEMLWLKKERAIADWEAVKAQPSPSKKTTKK
jgi:hypothetical protein